MGSVHDYEKCVDCGGVTFVDYYYKSGEEFSFCNRCGKSKSYKLKRDENNQIVLNENGSTSFVQSIKKGYGVYAMFNTDGFGHVGTLNNLDTIEDIMKSFKEAYGNIKTDKSRSFVARWDNGVQTIVLGSNLPDINHMDYDDLIDKWNSA